MTRDALTAEGFSAAAADVGMVNNWTAVADSSNVVPESDEGNNTRVNLDEAPIC